MIKRPKTRDYVTGTIFESNVEEIVREALEQNGNLKPHALSILDRGIEDIETMLRIADKEKPRSRIKLQNSNSEEERVLPYQITEVIEIYFDLIRRFQNLGVDDQNTNRFHSNDYISRVRELELDFIFLPGYSKRLNEVRRDYQKDGELHRPTKEYDKLGGGIDHDYGKLVENLREDSEDSEN